ncbi:MAG: phosphoribosylamine--glycine ligase [Lentisphaerae bacterium GWF2_52_8]|nr:MAG: phosphoribosylamine--glycine ligase [Lentisphaerae bacterium GWF2_52_8]
MNVLVIGNGGREHALCWKLAQSKKVNKLFCAPGNAGIAKICECVEIPADKINSLLSFAIKEKVDLTVVGPEAPLCVGVVDLFRASGLLIFGPDKSSARLEGSKSFAKDFMQKYGIPTAEAKNFSSAAPAEEYVRKNFAKGVKGLVVKADGLAAGKGVIVALNEKDALDGVRSCFGGSFGEAGSSVLIEECLFGEEVSILALTDANSIIPLASSQDHKRLLDGDQGPNTGGMGAYSPAPVTNQALMRKIQKSVLDKFLKGLKHEGLYYRGIIYAGIMVTSEGPKVLEFNVRFGDPETQAILPRLESDLAELMLLTAQGKLAQAKLAWSEDPAVCVVMASGGYPGNYAKNFEISGIEEADATGAVIFHAGTSIKDGKLVNSGGRVLGVTACGPDIRHAIDNAYKAVEKIHWQDAIFRKDIAQRALDR